MMPYMACRYNDGAMHKTTIYLPSALKAALERAAAETRRTESEIIREGLQWFSHSSRPRRRAAVYSTVAIRCPRSASKICSTALAGRDSS